MSTRDHSWGVRYDVGLPPTDVQPPADVGNFRFFWSPSYLERPDGSAYALFMTMSQIERPGLNVRESWGLVEHPDGRNEGFVEITPELAYDPQNRRLRGGQVHLRMRDASSRTIGVEVLSDTGFHLGAGLYFGSTATITATGAARCMSRASALRIARPPSQRGACIRSGTPWCASPIRSAGGPAGATGNRS